jgi:hypothetical protein
MYTVQKHGNRLVRLFNINYLGNSTLARKCNGWGTMEITIIEMHLIPALRSYALIDGFARDRQKHLELSLPE